MTTWTHNPGRKQASKSPQPRLLCRSGKDAILESWIPPARREEGLGFSLPDNISFYLPGALGTAIKPQLFLVSVLGGLPTQSL